MTQRHALFAFTTLLNVLSVTQAAEQPSLTVGVYNFANVPEGLMHSAANEAEYALAAAGVRFLWADCLAESHPCTAAGRSDFLTLRLLAHALPTSSSSALGVTSRSGDRAWAAVFCDRALALRTHEVPLAKLLGAAMAHEIVHMLLPDGSHSESGLMRAEWWVGELKAGSLAAAGLSRHACEMIRREAEMRGSGAAR